jgi:hypothetical protein
MTTLPPGILAVVCETARGAFGRRFGTAQAYRGTSSSLTLHPRKFSFLSAVVLAGALIAFAGTAWADDGEAVQFTEADYAAYSTLRFAKAMADEKRMFAHTKEKQAAVAAELAKACADVGWTKERFEQVDDAVGAALGALGDPENAGDEVSKTTLATVKAHQKELEDYDGLRKRAAEMMREQEMAARRGAPPTPAQLAGKWVLDMELTIAGMTEGLGDELKKTARDELRKTLVAASYRFGPGDRLVAISQRPGMAPETEEGTYQLEGSTLIVKAKMGKREHEGKLNIGIKDGYLRIGMMGFFSVFRRE